MVGKSGIVAVVGIAALAVIGAALIIATAAPQQDESGTLSGLEMEQSGSVIPGEQPTDTAENAIGDDSGETEHAQGLEQDVAGANATSGGQNNTGASGGSTMGGGSTTGGKMGDASGLDSSGAPAESNQ